jgi:hypothetical protein
MSNPDPRNSAVEPKVLYIECDLTDDQKLGEFRHGHGNDHPHWSARRALRRLAQRLAR